jgi:hypothetical protein
MLQLPYPACSWVPAVHVYASEPLRGVDLDLALDCCLEWTVYVGLDDKRLRLRRYLEWRTAVPPPVGGIRCTQPHPLIEL